MSEFLYPGQTLEQGQYLEAYPSGTVVRAQVDADCRFSVRWKLSADDPGHAIFDINRPSAGKPTLTYQTDGALVLRSSVAGELWRAPAAGQPGPVGEPAYARLLDNGQLQLVSRIPKGQAVAYWTSAPNLTRGGVGMIKSRCNELFPGHGQLTLSSDPPGLALPAGVEALPDDMEAVSVQSVKDDLSQRWEVTNLHWDGHTAGILRNQKTGKILWGPPRKYGLVGQSSRITPDTLWYFFDDFHHLKDSRGLRSINCGELALDVAGEGPYKPGSVLIFYDWLYPNRYNQLWNPLIK